MIHNNSYITASQLGEAVTNLRNRRGIVHQITNNVTIHDCANVVLAIGASPIMATHTEEVEEVTSLSQALVLNIGTIEEGVEYAMLLAGKSAMQANIPIVFDPVGAGATALRRRLSREIPEKLNIAVIRCNSSEIMAIYQVSYTAGGVDAVDTDLPVKEAAIAVAKKYNTVVAVTGESDLVTDGEHTVTLHNGVDKLPLLTGTGCMTSALVGAFATANSPFVAAVAGITCMSVAGEIAHARLKAEDGLGTFSIYLHDAISNMTAEIMSTKGRIENE